MEKTRLHFNINITLFTSAKIQIENSYIVNFIRVSKSGLNKIKNHMYLNIHILDIIH